MSIPSDTKQSLPPPDRPQPFGQSSSVRLVGLTPDSGILIESPDPAASSPAGSNPGGLDRSLVELLAAADTSSRYVIDRKIGMGGMSSVYRAADRDLSREVAVKVLENQEDPGARRKFIAEAQITGQLEHPNIVPIHELGVSSDGRLYFTLKLVKGTTLGQVLSELRSENQATKHMWPLSRLLRVFIDICNAVAFSHHKGVIHRDLKPSNILLGSYGEVLVTDWGLAKNIRARKIVGPDDQDVAVSDSSRIDPIVRFDDATLDGTLVGTPLYMSPEQASGDNRTIDQRSDIYSLGAVLYEILTLKTVVEGTRLSKVLEQIRTGLILPPNARTPDRNIAPDLSAIAMKALTRKREYRYAKVEELRNDVERFLENRTVSARDDSAWELLVKLVKRNRGPFITAVIASILLLGVLGAALLVNIRERKRTEDAFGQYRDSEKDRSSLIARDYYERQRAWLPVLREDFSDDSWRSRWSFDYGRWVSTGGKRVFTTMAPDCKIQDGMLLIRKGEPQLLYATQPIRGDIAIEFDCIEPGPVLNDLSCVIAAIRNVQPWLMFYTGYLFQYGGTSNTLTSLTRFNKSLVQEYASPIQAGRKYRVRGERDGNQLRLMIDGDTVYAVTDPKPLYGLDRDVVGIYGYEADQLIDNITIYKKGAAQKEDLLDIAQRYLQQDSLAFARSLYQQALAGADDQNRMDLARQGLRQVAFMEMILRNLPKYNAQIARAWPWNRARCQVDEDGLALDLGSDSLITSLDALRGIPLAHFSLQGRGKISSYDALRGMPLRWVVLGDSRLADLSLLRGAPLYYLEINSWALSDIADLGGMKIEFLALDRNKVSDLRPLAGMPLEYVSLRGTHVRDISPLRGLPVKELRLGSTDVSDLGPLRDSPLQLLWTDETPLTSLEPLRGMQIYHLGVRGTDVSDLSPLAGMPLHTLIAGETMVSSLTPLRDLRPSIVYFENTAVADLSPVKAWPLTEIFLSLTKVQSLEPLSGKSISRLGVYGVPMTKENLDIIRRFQLSSIEIDLSAPGALDFLRTHGSIESINAFPREFVLSVADDVVLVDNGESRPLRMYARQVGSKFYLAIPLLKTRQEATEFCMRAGGTLLSPSTREQGVAVNKYLGSIGYLARDVHLGLVTNAEGRPIRWASGDSVAPPVWSCRQDSLNAQLSQGVITHHSEYPAMWCFRKHVERLPFVIEWKQTPTNSEQIRTRLFGRSRRSDR